MDKLTTIISNTTTVDNGNCSIGRLAIEKYGEQRYFSIKIAVYYRFPEQKKTSRWSDGDEWSTHQPPQRPERLFPFKRIQKSHFH